MAPDESPHAELRQARQDATTWGVLRSERLEAVRLSAEPPVLDVGCSRGHYVQALASTGIPAVGVDLLVEDEWHTASAPYVCGDGRNLPFADRSFGTIIAFETLEHVAEPRRALAEWRRVVSRGLILTVPNAARPYWSRTARLNFEHHTDRTHVNFFDEDALLQLLESAEFTNVRVAPILPVNPFVPALDALGLPRRIVEGLGRRMSKLIVRPTHSDLLAVANVE